MTSSRSPIMWFTATAGTSAENEDEALLKVEHFLDDRSLRTFIRPLEMWLLEHEVEARIVGTGWRVDKETRREAAGTLKVFSERLYSLDAKQLRQEWTDMARAAREHVEEQRAWEAERAETFEAELRGDAGS